MGLLRRGPEGRLHVEVGSGRVWVVEELEMCGGGVECGREESEGEEGVRGREESEGEKCVCGGGGREVEECVCVGEGMRGRSGVRGV